MTQNEIKEELIKLNNQYGIPYILGYVRGLRDAKVINDRDYCRLHFWICDNLY